MRKAIATLPLMLATVLLLSAANAQTKIPLVQGLVIVNAAQRPEGDFEIVDAVTAASADSVEFTITLAAGGKDINGLKDGDTFARVVRRVDLQSAHRINAVMQTGDPPEFPGSTYAQLSAEVLQELKTRGESTFVLGWSAAIGAGDMMSALLTGGRKYYRGTLKRIDDDAAPIAVLVNGRVAALPVVHARGTLSLDGQPDIHIEGWWLDDSANALQLRARVQGRSSSNVVRIDFPAQRDSPQPALQTALARGDCRAELHGMYFASGSASLLPASKPMLAQIAQLLRDQGGWSLAIEGHTDNIGGTDYNLDLSRRRANAVREALVRDFGIDPSRLSSSGLGLTHPVDTNDTLEGRARNRRVELTRNCR